MGRWAEREAALQAIVQLRVRARLASMSLGGLFAAIERKQRLRGRPVLRVIPGGKASPKLH